MDLRSLDNRHLHGSSRPRASSRIAAALNAQEPWPMAYPQNTTAVCAVSPNQDPILAARPIRSLQAHEILIRVSACGVCRTDLHLIRGELPMARYPVIPGHEVVGTVAASGTGVTQWQVGDRVGVPWLGWA